MLRHIVAFLVAVVAGCASAPSTEPTIIEVLPHGYVVNQASIATPSELKAYLLARNVREVRILPVRDVPYVRVEETFIALRGNGFSFGIVGSESVQP